MPGRAARFVQKTLGEQRRTACHRFPGNLPGRVPRLKAVQTGEIVRARRCRHRHLRAALRSARGRRRRIVFRTRIDQTGCRRMHNAPRPPQTQRPARFHRQHARAQPAAPRCRQTQTALAAPAHVKMHFTVCLRAAAGAHAHRRLCRAPLQVPDKLRRLAREYRRVAPGVQMQVAQRIPRAPQARKAHLKEQKDKEIP